MRISFTMATAAVLLLAACAPASEPDDVPPPSATPHATETPVAASDVVLTMTAVATAADGAIADLTMTVHRAVAFDSPDSEVARSRILEWCAGEVDGDVLSGQGYTFTTIDVDAVVRSGSWAASSAMQLQPFTGGGSIMAADGDAASEMVGVPHCVSPTHITIPGSGHLYLGLLGDVDGDGDGTPAFGAFVKQRFGIVGGHAGVLSECTAVVGAAGTALGAPPADWIEQFSPQYCLIGAPTPASH